MATSIMETPAQQFLALPPNLKRRVHFSLVRLALDNWHDYATSRLPIAYADSVCGTIQIVDKKLPSDAFEAASRGCDVAKVSERYSEPITAMQDWDLEFPDPVKYAYYAVYNLFLKYAANEPINDWLIVNQALSSETDPGKWTDLLLKAINEAMNSTS